MIIFFFTKTVKKWEYEAHLLPHLRQCGKKWMVTPVLHLPCITVSHVVLHSHPSVSQQRSSHHTLNLSRTYQSFGINQPSREMKVRLLVISVILLLIALWNNFGCSFAFSVMFLWRFLYYSFIFVVCSFLAFINFQCFLAVMLFKIISILCLYSLLH